MGEPTKKMFNQSLLQCYILWLQLYALQRDDECLFYKIYKISKRNNIIFFIYTQCPFQTRFYLHTVHFPGEKVELHPPVGLDLECIFLT